MQYTFNWVPQYGPYLLSVKYIKRLRRLLIRVNFFFFLVLFCICFCCFFVLLLLFCCCCCDALNRTGANFVMVELVLRTFVTRLLFLVHFQLFLCMCFAFLLSFFFFCMLLLSVYHSLDNDRSPVETWCFNVGFYREMFLEIFTFKLFCFILFIVVFLFTFLFCFQ